MLNSVLAERLRPNFDDDRDADTFLLRLERYAPDLIGSLEAAYGPERVPALLDGLLETMLLAFHTRPAPLKQRDEVRLLRPDGWQEPEVLVYVAALQNFTGEAGERRGRLAALRDLGVSVLHLEGHPASPGDLAALARDLRSHDLSLGLDVTLDAALDWPPEKGGAPTPETFRATLDRLLALAGAGAEVLRLSGLWPSGLGGLNGEPPAPGTLHLLRALRAGLRVVAPATALWAAAPPEHAASLLGLCEHHGQLFDAVAHPGLTPALWDALNRADTSAALQALEQAPARPPGTVWTLDLWTGQPPAAPADRAGLSAAVAADDDAGITEAIARLRLLHAALLGFGGVPLLHEGDERGLSGHSRADPDATPDATPPDINTPAGRMFAWTQKLVAARRTLPHLHASIESRPVPSPDPRVLLLWRDHPLGPLLAVYNFSAGDVAFPTAVLRGLLGERATDHLSGQAFTFNRATLRLEPYRALWLTRPD